MEVGERNARDLRNSVNLPSESGLRKNGLEGPGKRKGSCRKGLTKEKSVSSPGGGGGDTGLYELPRGWGVPFKKSSAHGVSLSN